MSLMIEGCEDCDHGWRRATEEYVAELFPMPPNATEEQIEHVWQLREIYDLHVFPCPACWPQQFQRWANGCMRPEHRSAKCELCLEAMGERAAARHDRASAGRIQE